MLLSLRRVWLAAILALSVIVALSQTASAQDTMLIHGDDIAYWTGADTSVQQYLQATNILTGNITIFDASSNTGQAAPSSLAGYSSVLVWGDIGISTLYGFLDPAALGNLLADFVDNGGTVVICHVAHLWAQGLTTQLEGRFLTSVYSPFQTSDQYDDTTTVTLGTVAQSAHPVMSGVNSADAGTYPWHSPLQLSTGATLIASWSDSTPLVAVKATGQGYVFGLNFYPVGTNYFTDTIDLNTDIDTLVANCLAYPGGTTPTPSAAAFTVAAGTNASTQVRNDAQGTGNGGIQAAVFTITNTTANSGNVTAIEISASGSGDDSADFSEVGIFFDANANGSFEAGTDTRVGTAATAFPTDNGSLTFTLASNQQTFASMAARTYFVVVKMSGSGSAGETFNFSVSDITVTSPATKTGVPMASAMSGVEILPGDLSLTINAGSLAQTFANEAGPSGGGYEAADFSISNGAIQQASISSITVQGEGTADHTSIYTEFAIYRDASTGTTGSFDSSDVRIGTGTFSGSPATTTISVNGAEQNFAVNETKTYFIVIKLNAMANPGDTISWSVTAIPTGNSQPVGNVPSGTMLGVEILQPSLLFSDVSASAPATAYPGNSVALQAIRVRYPAGPAETLASMTFEATGSGHDVDDISEIKLYRDANANGTFEDGTDVLISTGMPAFSSDDGSVTIDIDSAQQALPGNSDITIFMVVTFNFMPSDNDRFQTKLVSVTGPSGAIATSGIPAPAAAMGYQNSDFAAGARILANALVATENGPTGAAIVVQNDAADQLLLDFELSALATDWTVSSLTFQAAGTANDQIAYSELALYEDTNNNGMFDGAPDDALAGPKGTSFSLDNGGIDITLNNGVFMAAMPRRFFFVGSLAGTAGAGETLQVSLGLVSGSPSSGIASVIGVPTANASGLEIAPAELRLELNGLNTPASVNSTSAGVLGEGELLYDLSLESINGGFNIVGFEFTASGLGDDSTAFSEIALYEDKNGNGMFDGSATDTLAGVKATGFSADDGSITMNIADNPIAAAATRRFFLLGILAGTAQPGDTFNFTLSSINAAPATSGVIGTLPARSATALLIGQSSLTVSAAPFNPADFTKLRDGTDFTHALGAIRFAANNGSAVVNGITLTAGGSADWTSTLAGGNGIRIYLDDGDETFNASTDSLIYGTAGGSFSIAANFASALMINNGGHADIWLVLNVLGSTGGSTPRSFQLSVVTKNDVMASGVSDVVMGSPNPASSTLTVIEFHVDHFAPIRSPDLGGSPIIIQGVGLVGATGLTIGGIPADGAPTVLPDGTQITGWRVPEGTGVNLPIVLTTPVLGNQTLPFTFTYTGIEKTSNGSSGGSSGFCSLNASGNDAWIAIFAMLAAMSILFVLRRQDA